MKLTENLQRYRDNLIYKEWEKLKNDKTMKDLADIFNLPLVTVYKILKKQSK